MKVYEILEATKGILVSGNKEDEICFFSQDSRQMKNGGMYIPLKGERFDGHDFIESAFQTGATAIITAKDVSYPDKIVIKVEDTYQALKDMAIYLRSHRPVKVVGVTGSVGKTSTRDMVYSVVKQKYKTLKTEGNYNNEIGLPLTILRYQDEEVMVLEMGMNHLNEMSRLSMIAHPDVSCITNVGTAHIGELGSRENILKAKLEITDGMKDQSTLIINNDNDMLQTVDLPRLNVVRVGKNEGASIQASDIELFEDHSTFIVHYHDQSEKIWVPVQGEHNVFNALIAIAVAIELNISLEDIKKGIQEFKLTKNRMDILEKNHKTIIDGTYNASVDSMKSSIDVLANYKKRKVAILADMLELGDYSQQLHEEVGNYVATKEIDVLICIGKEAKYMYQKAKEKMKNVYYFTSNQEVIEQLDQFLKNDDVVLVKGSHSMNLKEIVEKMNLKNLTPDVDLVEKYVQVPDINRPALQLSGYFDHFDSDRVQVIGYVEYTYLQTLEEAKKMKMYDELLSHKIPCLIFSRALEPDQELLEKATQADTPVLITQKSTSSFMAELIRWMNVKLAPCISIHGVLVDVYGVGVLIMGESGIGKSEAALELIKRGHRLVTDDVVEIRKVSDDTLVGSAPDITRHFIELRGIGIVDVKSMFGVQSVRETQNIDLVITLEDWSREKEYDRLGLEETYTEFLGNKVVCHNIPIRPGRNLAIIVESAAVNHRQKQMGYNAAQELYKRVQNSFTKSK